MPQFTSPAHEQPKQLNLSRPSWIGATTGQDSLSLISMLLTQSYLDAQAISEF